MNNSDKLISMINELNDEGLELVTILVNYAIKNEGYNKNTSIERINEIRKEKIADKQKLKESEQESYYKQTKETYQRIQSKKEALDKKGRRFLSDIGEVKQGKYYLRTKELRILANIYENNLIDGSGDIYKIGFLRGQRAEKAMRKKKMQTNKFTT